MQGNNNENKTTKRTLVFVLFIELAKLLMTSIFALKVAIFVS